MATTLATFRTRLRRRLRDPDSQIYTDNTEIDAWINAACEQINQEIPNKLTTGSINTDGSASEYSMVAALTGFLRLKQLRVTDQGTGRIIKRHPQGMDYIDRVYNEGLIVADTPQYYAFEYPNIAFDRIPDATLNVNARYFSTLTAMTASGNSPDGMLAIGNWDRLILGMACLQALSDIQNTEFNQLLAAATEEVYGRPGLIGELAKFKEFVLSHAEFRTTSGIPEYSELGGEPEVSEPRLEGMRYGR